MIDSRMPREGKACIATSISINRLSLLLIGSLYEKMLSFNPLALTSALGF
jgi:hypothetical protein